MTTTRPARLARLRSGLLATGTVVALAVAGIALTPLSASAADAPLSVTVATDQDPAGIGACTDPSVVDPASASALSLREAVCVANNRGGTQAIVLPAGTLSMAYGEFQVGTTSGSSISITGAGAGTTAIDAAGASRILELDPDLVGGVAVSIAAVTLRNGLPSASGPSGSFGGGAVLGGSDATPLDSLTVSDAAFVGNTAAQGTATNAPGGAIQMAGGSLTVLDTTFSQNTAGESSGGAIAFLGGGAAGETLRVTDSTFANNTVTNSGAAGAAASGGAMSVRGAASGSAVTGSTFTRNSATGTGTTRGGAIAVESGTLAVTTSSFDTNAATSTGDTGSGGAIAAVGGAVSATYDRFTGNVATVGSAIAQSSATVTANDDWWGCNTGPTGAGCQTASGTVTAARWLQFTASAAPATIAGPNGTSVVTGTFSKDSDGTTIVASQLGAFAGLNVAFAVDGNGDAFAGGATTTTVQSSAAGASATYDSGTAAGARNVRVTALGVTATTVVTVQTAPAITSGATAGFTLGTAGSFAITSTGSPTATISSTGTLPTGLTFTPGANGTATIAGTPTQGGSFPLTITADNGTAPAATQSLTISVTAAPTITSGATATFRAGTAGSFTVTTTGTPAPAITAAGTRPSGLTFVDNGDGTATLAGTAVAAQAGTFVLNLTANNGAAPNAVQALTVQVTTAPVVTTNPTAQTVQPGTPVSLTAAASGFPTPTVQWQRSADGGASYTAIAGATATTYAFTAAAADDGNRYRAVFTNSAGIASTTAAEVRVGNAPLFTSQDSTRVVAGSALSFSVTTSGTPAATLSAAPGQLPTWLTLTDHGDGTGTLAGTAPAGASGVSSFTLTAANGFSPDASQPFTLSVDAPPTITSADHATFRVGAAGSFTVRATNGFPTTTALATVGSLPAGVTFVDQGDGTGTLSGTPAAATGGTYPVTIQATATGGTAPATTQSFVLTVDQSPVITSSDDATFRVGTAGTASVTTTGGFPTATALSVTGTLPDGVTFTDAGDGTGAFAGTPLPGTGGAYIVTLRAEAVDGSAPAATQTVTIVVDETTTITSAGRTTFVAGADGTFTVTTAGGFPVATALTATGALPDGVTFTDAGDGTATIAGTPTRGTGGAYPVTIRATNGGTSSDATQQFVLQVDESATITSGATAAFRVGDAGSFAVTASDGTPTVTGVDVVGTLPAGLQFAPNDDGTVGGSITGTPEAGTAGVSTVTVVAHTGGSAPDATEILTIVVADVPAVTSDDHATFGVGGTGTFTVTTTPGYPTETAVVSTTVLPTWLTLTDAGDGTATLSGTPTAADTGTVVIGLRATNDTGSSAVQQFTLTVTNSPVIEPIGPQTFGPGEPVAVTIDTADTFPVPALSLDTIGGPTLPAGLTFTDLGDGSATITGTPTGPSVTDLVVVADNGIGDPARATFTLTVEGRPTITSPDAATFRVGDAGSFDVTATNGVPTDTVLSVRGTLPAGLTFVQQDTDTPTLGGLVQSAFDTGTTSATIAGTPTTAGTYRVSVRADNGVGDPVVQDLVLTVDARAVVPGSGSSANPGGGGSATTPATTPGGAASTTGGLAFTGGTVPWAAAAIGLALVIAGLVLTLRRRRHS